MLGLESLGDDFEDLTCRAVQGLCFWGSKFRSLKGSGVDQALPEGNEQVACRMGMVSTSNDGYRSGPQGPKTLDS